MAASRKRLQLDMDERALEDLKIIGEALGFEEMNDTVHGAMELALTLVSVLNRGEDLKLFVGADAASAQQVIFGRLELARLRRSSPPPQTGPKTGRLRPHSRRTP